MKVKEARPSPANPFPPVEFQPPSIPRRWVVGLLLVILAAGGILRLISQGQSPPGMNVDEAANAWNAYCLQQTGMDQHGVRWPVFRARMFGEADNRSTLFLYYLLPFVAVSGMKLATVRVAAAVAGLVVIWLTYFVGSRLFGRLTGIVAAALLALNPWHLQQSRWGHEAILSPLLVMAPLAAFLCANLITLDGEDRGPRPILAAVAGLVAGASCYGYQSIRIFLPAFLTLVVILDWRAWRQRLQARCGALALASLVIAFALFFVPLAWKQFTDPGMSGRARAMWVWNETDTVAERFGKALSRYPGHFGLDFLFVAGDGYAALSPPAGHGLFPWYTLPLMLLGLTALWHSRSQSSAARLLFLWLVTYPVGDLVTRHPNPHALRSLPGLCALVLLAAWGAVYAGSWLWRRKRPAAVALACALGFALITSHGRFLYDFYGAFNRDQRIYHYYHPDLLEALDWLQPRFESVDAVFCTVSKIPHPYIYALVRLGYDPKRWFTDVRDVVKGPLPNGMHPFEDVYFRVGKIHFLYPNSRDTTLRDLYENRRSDRIIFIVRPGEIRFKDTAIRPLLGISDPGGSPSLLVYELIV